MIERKCQVLYHNAENSPVAGLFSFGFIYLTIMKSDWRGRSAELEPTITLI